MEEEDKQGEVVEETDVVDTQHKPHKHALRRILIGIGAIACIVFGSMLWSSWGEEIKEACFGDGEVCAVELPETPSDN